MNLYQWGEAYQRHYVVAKSYADAEATIKVKYGWTCNPKQIEDLGPYVQVSDAVLKELKEEKP